MRISPRSIGSKLLYSFLAITVLMITASLIGISGFSFVAKTEQRVVNDAIPSMIEARQVSELSSRIINSSQQLTNAKDDVERKQAGAILFNQLDRLLDHIQSLGSGSFDGALLQKLENNVQKIIDNFAELGLSVEKRLLLNSEIESTVLRMQVQANELESLTRTQVLNTSTVAVANVAHIYDLLDGGNKDAVYRALDSLVEVDLDLSERLHELHLLAFRLLTQIEEVKTVTDFERLLLLREQYESNLTIMSRRVKSVEDPSRSVKMGSIIADLREHEVVFEWLMQRHKNNQLASDLNVKTLDNFTELNQIVSQLIDISNQSTEQAIEQVSNTLNYAQWTLILISIVGLTGVVLIVWRVVYQSVVIRLSEYSDALRSVASGQLDISVTIKGNDEMAGMGHAIINARDTARSLKVLAERESASKLELEEYKEHLEEVVSERTEQLQATNKKLNHEVLNHAKARKDAEQANRAKSSFLATISHEIRTPLNGVLGTATLLKDTHLNTHQSQYVEIIDRSGTNLLSIINDVLDYSKIEAGHLKINNAPFDLHMLVNDVQQLLLSRANEKRLSLYTHIEADVGQYWVGDKTRLCQILTNLVGNAIKFTTKGDIDVYVSIDPDNSNTVCFEVNDTGLGIAEQEQPHLFDAFTQASSGEKVTGGTGLGLAICKRLVNAMKGSIGVESALGDGSRFWFKAPLQVGSAEEHGIHHSENQYLSSMCCTGANIDIDIAANILLVEDNPVNCVVAEGFLQSLGHTVTTVMNGQAAEAMFSQHEYDMALLDINLPDCSGTELVQRLKQIEAARNNDSSTETPMIAVSAHVFNEEITEYLAAGFDGFLPKPIVKDALRALIIKTLSKSNASNVLEAVNLTVVSMEASALKSASKTGKQQWLNLVTLTQDLEVLGEAKMNNLVELFVESSDQIWGELEQAEQLGDHQAVKSLVHKLKGSAGSMALKPLLDICHEIEGSADPLAKFTQQKSEMKYVLEQSAHALKQFVSS
ncbi:TMAO reductase system sensor histidine kinase/response regulator TorS [Vibrio tapetis subsp. quintayensis]|uniref:TMAO reductase system sensor histidine kinase/response regulator TorS n=1 Tax=Vibrio tapetis TaxID=52443 RepID=UPI0025B5B331|nr:TMAO reductase system sensor histidine kinase/response regulator TorS [Vibrio tapetis]MDN3678740.1 TMAO reductase system sensor histidine kinase/response regulator TorS [Vibrio tapetis subsp. quintayensis]